MPEKIACGRILVLHPPSCHSRAGGNLGGEVAGGDKQHLKSHCQGEVAQEMETGVESRVR